jgi:hypothetical protein
VWLTTFAGRGWQRKKIDYEDGRTMAWSAPIEHNAINISADEVRVLEIEYKRATG